MKQIARNNPIRLLLAAVAVLAALMVVGPQQQLANAQDAPAGERRVVMKDALIEYAKARGMPLFADPNLQAQAGEVIVYGGDEDLTDLVPAMLFEKRMGIAETGGTLRLLLFAQLHSFARLVNDAELETARPFEWVSHVFSVPGVDVNIARTAMASHLTRESSLMPLNIARSSGGVGLGALMICDRADNVRRIKSLANELSARALAQPEIVVVDIPEGLKGDEVVRIFRSAAGVAGELFQDGRRFIGTCDPGTGDSKRETMQRLIAEMARK
jgi:hypothetical protein